jgi:murein DD-endopeptidase MepM/ murein hydrolase activator NlpD
MAKPINIRAVAEGVRGPVADTEKAIVRFSKFIRRNDSKLRNFKFPSKNRMKYLKTIDLSVIGKNSKGGFALSLPSPFGMATNALLGRMLQGASIAVILGTAGAWLPALVPGLINTNERKTAKAPGTREEKLRALYEQKKNLNWWDWITGVAQELDEQIYFLETGQTRSYGKNLTPRTPEDFGPGKWTEGNTKKLNIGKFASGVTLFGTLASAGIFTQGIPVSARQTTQSQPISSIAIPVSRKINTSNYGSGGLHPFPGGNYVSSPVGMRNGRMHHGTDIAETTPYRKNPRTPIIAMSDGVVIDERYNGSKDAYLAGVMINHADLNIDARYLHMNPSVQPGDAITRGQIIGTLVPLGGEETQYKDTHLHLELYKQGTYERYSASQSSKFLGGLHKIPFAEVNNATSIQPSNPNPTVPPVEPQSSSAPQTKVIPTQKESKDKKDNLAVLTEKLEELQSSHDISRVDEKVRIPEVGTYVLGRNFIGAREDKYFDVNGKPISLDEFENKLVLYEDKLDKQAKVDPQKASTIPDASSTANPPQSNSVELPPSIITPTKRQEPPVNQYPSYNRPNRVNNTIIASNQLPQKHKSMPNFMSSGGSNGGNNVANGVDMATISQSILLTQLSGS